MDSTVYTDHVCIYIFNAFREIKRCTFGDKVTIYSRRVYIITESVATCRDAVEAFPCPSPDREMSTSQQINRQPAHALQLCPEHTPLIENMICQNTDGATASAITRITWNSHKQDFTQ